MRSEPWNEGTAREALILLRQAHEAWTTLMPTALAPDQDSDPVQTLRTLHQHITLALAWVRGLDDMAHARDGLAGYPDTWNDPGVELVDAAVYACNRVVHQLIHVGRYNQGGRSYPRTYPVTYNPASLTWVTAEALPPESADSGRMPWRRRTAYLNRWAGQPMTDGLAEIRAFMDAEIGPAVEV
ncbi:hypothetical protein GCM10009613_05550 [Pseudonocardia kongjuensis]|uniref:DinB family protein n=1 Tax=Pseudonocardia kongjuensis TaxID=102227 RepID=A0ABP4I4U8_9PSEU